MPGEYNNNIGAQTETGTFSLLLTSDNAEADKDLRTLLIRADELCRIINDRIIRSEE